MVCLGFEPGTKVLKVLTNPLGYCGPQKLCSVNPKLVCQGWVRRRRRRFEFKIEQSSRSCMPQTMKSITHFLHTGGACDGWKFFNYAKPFRLFTPVKIVLCKTKLNRFKNIKNYIFIIVCILCTLFKNALTRRRSGFEQVIILCKINSFSILKFRLGSAGDSFRASAHHHYYSPVNSWKINFFCFIHNSSETSIDQSLPFQCDQIWRNIAILAKMFKSLAIFKGLLIIW